VKETSAAYGFEELDFDTDTEPDLRSSNGSDQANY